MSREHRRAKTDRLDTGLLRRAFLGWLRGEPDHCSMVAIPTLEEEDAKRPNRERESLIGERTRIINRMRGCLARLGIRSFRPTLRKAPGRLETLRTPEGVTLPPNTLAELRRDMARLRFVSGQITEIEQARLERLRQAPDERPHAMVRLLARVIGVGIETADMLVHEVLSRDLRDRRARPLRRPDRLAGGERRQAAGEGARQGGQRARAPRHDPARLVFSPVPGGQRSGGLVPGTDSRRSRRHAQDHDRGVGAQAAHRAVAFGDHRRDAGRCRPASGGVRGLGRSRAAETVSRSAHGSPAGWR